MAKVYFGMIVSLDGFVNDREGKISTLYESYKPHAATLEADENTGAVVMGRNSFEMAEDTDGYADHYEFQVPLFVLTHTPPAKHPKENDKLTITFVTDGIEEAIRQAKIAANGKDVLVLGANVCQQLLRANLADELQIAFAPVLLGKGVRFFEHMEEHEIYLEKIKAIETEQQVEVWYKVLSGRIPK